jgi:NCS1 family nucleobase:cation symporter-1
MRSCFHTTRTPISILNNILELTVAFLGPALAIYGIDILLRRNRYNGAELHDETPRSRFWYWRGVNPAGATAMIAGTAAALLCINTAIYVSPVARLVVGAALYATLSVRQRRCVPAADVTLAVPAMTAD